mgnify:CR=1 FL=1
MFEDLTELILASALFLGGHVILSAESVRGPLRAKLGGGPFQGLYSLIAVGALVWMTLAYFAAPETKLWQAPTRAIPGGCLYRSWDHPWITAKSPLPKKTTAILSIPTFFPG